jgi:hypothetical protein
MRKFVLIKQCIDYADEFDVYAFDVVPKDEWEANKKRILELTYELEYYFGTNEELTFADGEDYLNQIVVSDISEEEAQTLDKLFDGEFGNSAYQSILRQLDYEEEL